MSLSGADILRLVERIQWVRSERSLAYAIAVVAVAIGAFVRWVLRDFLPEGLAFVSFFPAIVIASLFGGFWPGMLATVLSELIGSLIFLPASFESTLTGSTAVTSLVFFLFATFQVAVVSALNLALDQLIIQEKRLENEIEQRKETEVAARYHMAIVESSDDAIIAKDLNGIVTSWNRGAEALFGYTAAEMIGKPINTLIPADRPNEEPAILQRLRSGERIDHYETMRKRKDGTLVDISLTVSPVTDDHGKIVGASKIARDISALKKAVEQQELLISEMRHRLKNTIAVINAIILLSARSARTPDELAQKIASRLVSLSRAHDLTRPGLLQKASRQQQPTTFQALVRAILSPYVPSDERAEQARLMFDGPDASLSEEAATGLALLLHELATNSVKCGSLSSAEGRVRIESVLADGQYLVTWKEEGGPRLNGPPHHEGFGTLVSRRIVTSQLGGDIAHDWRAEGLVVRFSTTLDQLKK